MRSWEFWIQGIAWSNANKGSNRIKGIVVVVDWK